MPYLRSKRVLGINNDVKYPLISVLLLVTLTSCFNKPQPPITPPPPKQVESALPSVKTGNDKVDAAIGQNQLAKAELEAAYRRLKLQDLEISETLRKLKELKVRLVGIDGKTEINIDDLIRSLESIQLKNRDLDTSNKQLAKIVAEQDKTLKEVKQNLDLAEKQIIDKDNEVLALRDQNEHYRKVIDNQQAQINVLNKNIDKISKSLASASVYKHWVIGLIVAIVLWFIIKKALMLYVPAIGGRLW